MSVNELDGEIGFMTHGENRTDWLGFAVSDAGDVNDDNIDDFAVSALNHDGGGEDAGAVYVIFGTEQGFNTNLDLSTLDGSNGFMIMGEATEDQFGHSISNVGDINGDGVNELAMMANEAETPGLVDNGITYVMFGRQSYPAVVSLSTFDGSHGGFTIHGKFAGDRASDVSSAGNFNADNFNDLIIGTQAHDPGVTNAGAAYVIFGTDQGFPAILDLGDINGTNGVAFWGENGGDIAGYKVSGAGDIGGDGSGDVMIAAIKESSHATQSGAVYMVFGKRQQWPAAISLDMLDGNNGYKLTGEEEFNLLGLALSGSSDINNDGKDDVLIAARFNNPDSTSYYQAYIIFGKDNTMAPSQSIDVVADLLIKTPSIPSSSPYNFDAGFVGNLNGDNIPDLAIGDPYNSEVGNYSGAVYVVYGSQTFVSTELLTDQLSDTEGFKILGGNWNDRLGSAISTAGDVNHDGIDDLLLGAHMTDNTDTDAGSAYILFGNDVIFADAFEASQ
ncbi:hypothetical protein GCM10011365_08500 [Marinicella pacifica]|uniref:FG-GAP repeat protein n=1 Tax=Marinicella pacifica TaxID=1171543 RepID=A0A917CKL2_9GAMM|nr:integrin alpha [Marinicella pacifica]GGF89624.1 hypothetical protein GCM10011365_08500 [Marinicella pacifica]